MYVLYALYFSPDNVIPISYSTPFEVSSRLKVHVMKASAPGCKVPAATLMVSGSLHKNASSWLFSKVRSHHSRSPEREFIEIRWEESWGNRSEIIFPSDDLLPVRRLTRPNSASVFIVIPSSTHTKPHSTRPLLDERFRRSAVDLSVPGTLLVVLDTFFILPSQLKRMLSMPMRSDWWGTI